MERFIEPCLILLLLKTPAHGYDLLSRLEEFGLDPERQDPGLLYRTLRRLEEDGYLTSHWDTGAGGPAKRLYEVTKDGEELLHAWSEIIRRNLRSLTAFLDLYQAHFAVKEGDGDTRP
ncbi:MAG: helix-turn-helix transcriptional regulator [Bacteroidota bacterium]